jgi:hypothetical protein
MDAVSPGARYLIVIVRKILPWLSRRPVESMDFFRCCRHLHTRGELLRFANVKCSGGRKFLFAKPVQLFGVARALTVTGAITSMMAHKWLTTRQPSTRR